MKLGPHRAISECNSSEHGDSAPHGVLALDLILQVCDLNVPARVFAGLRSTGEWARAFAKMANRSLEWRIREWIVDEKTLAGEFEALMDLGLVEYDIEIDRALEYVKCVLGDEPEINAAIFRLWRKWLDETGEITPENTLSAQQTKYLRYSELLRRRVLNYYELTRQ